MLSPLHWHDYKKKYGKLDDFVASHPEVTLMETLVCICLFLHLSMLFLLLILLCAFCFVLSVICN